MNKLNRSALIAVVIFSTISLSAFAQKSPRKQAKGTVSGIVVDVDYGSPSVKGRKVWGGLEKYGRVWRAGANENTTISFDQDVTIAGKKLQKGKYGFFIIPNETADWIVIFNKRNKDWGAYSYTAKEDALRTDIAPSKTKTIQEGLKYEVTASGIVFKWEYISLTIPVGK